MLLSTLLAVSLVAPVQSDASLLAAVPDDAYLLVHCRDLAALRSRAELNDWMRLLDSKHGEPLVSEIAREFRSGTHTELDSLIDLALNVHGEGVLFASEDVVGFVTTPPPDKTALAAAMRAWLPPHAEGSAPALVAGARAQLAAWPDEIDGWQGRKGHFAAFIDHPRLLGLYSADSAEVATAALAEGIAGLESARSAPLVDGYRAAGGGASGGIETYVDFSPFVAEAERTVKQAVDGLLPDPTGLLGLEAGTWLHVTADVFPGTRVDCRARLNVPKDTLAARLADTFEPLPHALPTMLPKGTWCVWSLRWDLKSFYEILRAAFEEKGGPEGLQVVDQGRAAAEGMTGVDPIEDVVNQLEGTFAAYFLERAGARIGDETEALNSFGMLATLADGAAFLEAFDRLVGVGGIQEALDLIELEGVDTYVFKGDENLDGGLAFLPRAFVGAPGRDTLLRSLRALTLVDGASLLDGSRTQAAIDENAGACFFSCIELALLKAWTLPDLEAGTEAGPDSEGGVVLRDPFDSQLVYTARRTKDGFELRLATR